MLLGKCRTLLWWKGQGVHHHRSPLLGSGVLQTVRLVKKDAIKGAKSFRLRFTQQRSKSHKFGSRTDLNDPRKVDVWLLGLRVHSRSKVQ